MSVKAHTDSIHSKAIPDLVAKLLRERQEMLVLYNRLAALKPYARINQVGPLLGEFCQVLVDYMALGHFEVYQGLEDNASDTERCRNFKHLARKLHPLIVKTTQTAIDFNDRYESPDQPLDSLVVDLCQLGEALATRIDLEDQLLAILEGRRLTAVH